MLSICASVENNITVLVRPGGEYYVNFLANSPIPEYQTLSKHMRKARDWDEYYRLIEHGVIGNGTYVSMDYCLDPWRKSLGRWWKGNLMLGDSPYVGYLSDKKWYLNEVFDKLSYIFYY